MRCSVLKWSGALLQTMVMCMSLGYIGFVALLHIIGKVRLPLPLCSASHLDPAVCADGVLSADPRGVSTAKAVDGELAAGAGWCRDWMGRQTREQHAECNRLLSWWFVEWAHTGVTAHFGHCSAKSVVGCSCLQTSRVVFKLSGRLMGLISHKMQNTR